VHGLAVLVDWLADTLTTPAMSALAKAFVLLVIVLTVLVNVLG
jgi:hypothetical protein